MTPALRQLCNDHVALRQAVLHRMDRCTRIGWVDFSPLSWDYRVADARAFRISQRLVYGKRWTRRQLQLEGLFIR